MKIDVTTLADITDSQSHEIVTAIEFLSKYLTDDQISNINDDLRIEYIELMNFIEKERTD